MLLERLPDSLPSLGSIASTLLALKIHGGLPTMSSWTEADPTLSVYLDVAELMVDKLCGFPYRQRSFKLSLTNLQSVRKTQRRPPWYTSSQLYGLKLPIHPVVPATTSIVSTDDSGVVLTYIEGVDYQLYGPTSLTPEVVFPYTWTKPSTVTLPYPYIMTFQAGGSGDSPVALLAIFELATYFYRNPEAMAEANASPGVVFDAHIDFLKGSFF